MQWKEIFHKKKKRSINDYFSILPWSSQSVQEIYSGILTRIMQLASRDLEHASDSEGKAFEAG